MSGANPPSSPTAVEIFLASRIFLRAWNTSEPQRKASRNDCMPTGTIIISCMSRRLLACAPPLIRFIIGTGMRIAPEPPK